MRNVLLAPLALAAAWILLAPAAPSFGFIKNGRSLAVTARDFRLFNNFTNPQANDNTTGDPNYPGWFGAELAVWKAATEWGSEPFGTGAGDPTQPILGSGNANFDFVFAGRAAVAGGPQSNILAVRTGCLPGQFGFLEHHASGRWEGTFCDQWTWVDGPSAPTSATRIDIQGVATYLLGAALGLADSNVPNAAMSGSSLNGAALRDLVSDDQLGLQCIYGAKDPTKTRIDAVTIDPVALTLTIDGANFAATDNEVWFTNPVATPTGSNPVVKVTGLSSNGTQIVLSIPATAGSGGLHVKTPGGHSSLSNAFPVNLGQSPDTPGLALASVTPAVVDALLPGTDKTVTISGDGFDENTTVEIGGVTLPVSSVEVQDAQTLRLDMPILSSLGPQTVTVRRLFAAPVSSTIDVQPPGSMQLQCGNGDQGVANIVSGSFDVHVSGTPGELHFVTYSGSSVPSKFLPFACLDLGNNFSDLFELGRYVVDPISAVTSNTIPLPSTSALFYMQSISLAQGLPVAKSNLQSILIVP